MQLTRTKRMDGHYTGGDRPPPTHIKGKPVHVPKPLTLDRQSLAAQWTGLPKFVIARFYGGCSNAVRDELESVGLLALTEAADRFDQAKGILFSTFATSWIRGRMLSFLCDESAKTRPFVDAPEVESGDRFDSLIPDPSEVPELDEQSSESVKLRAALSKIPSRYYRVIVDRYGLAGPKKTMREIAAELGVSHQAVKQAEDAALRALRREMGVA